MHITLYTVIQNARSRLEMRKWSSFRFDFFSSLGSSLHPNYFDDSIQFFFHLNDHFREAF